MRQCLMRDKLKKRLMLVHSTQIFLGLSLNSSQYGSKHRDRIAFMRVVMVRLKEEWM